MQIITLAFSDKHRASEILSDLGDLDVDWGVPIDQAAAAITVNKRGKVHVHQSHAAAGTGAFFGGLTGFVAGMLVFAPGVGAAIGAATGGAIGSAADPEPLDGIDKGFLKQLGNNLAIDSSALVVLVPNTAADTAMAALRAYDDGTIAEATVDADVERKIQAAYDKYRKKS